MLLSQADLNILRASNDKFVENTITSKLLDVGGKNTYIYIYIYIYI